MTTLVVRGPTGVDGRAKVPGDKSISHRALMFGAMAIGRSRIEGLAPGMDAASTMNCLSAYGVRFSADGSETVVTSPGAERWGAPEGLLDCGNSGTTMRLLAGLAAHHAFESVLDGDESLRRRPMDRVARPLGSLGARVEVAEGGFPPMIVSGGALVGAAVETEVASAQVKSAVLLAGLAAKGTTEVTEPLPTRDHTERMLEAMGAPIEWGEGFARVEAWRPEPFELDVPGDFSSATFVFGAAAVGGSAEVARVGLNPGRVGFLEVLERMGAKVASKDVVTVYGEPVGDVKVEGRPLSGVEVARSLVPRLHDELPLFAVVASQAEGRSVVLGAEELRVKETDRITATCRELRKLGADIDELPDGFVVRGPVRLTGTDVESHGDHRMAMALAVAGLAAEGETRVHGFEAASVSWPGFERTLAEMGAEIELR